MAFGLHFTDTYAGRVFSQCTSATGAAGLAIPILTNVSVGGGLPLWNPPASNRVVELISLDVQYASGTAEYASIGLMGGPLSALASTAICSAFASATPMSGYLMGGGASKILSCSGGTVTVTAGVGTPPTAGSVAPGWFRSLGAINLEAQTGTAHATVGGPTYTFNGGLLLPPGTMIYVATVRASVALYNLTWVWKEIALNPGQG